MVRAISTNFVPVKIHIKEQKQTFDRFGALWTPTQIILDLNGVERHRIEGFLPVEDFLARLELGLARVAFEDKRFAEAERRYRTICDEYPHTGAAPEACYWAGVSAYKATNQPQHLKETLDVLRERYPDTEWARRASVWGSEKAGAEHHAA